MWAEAEWFWADWEPEWYGLCKCQGLGSQVWGKSKKSLRRPQAILSGRGERVLHQLSGGRAPAERAELTSGDPRLPAEDEHSPPFLSLPLLLFPLPLPGL